MCCCCLFYSLKKNVWVFFFYQISSRTRAKFRFWFFIMLLWKMRLSIGVWMNAKYVCIHSIYLSYITSLSITDESFVNQIDWSEIDFHIKYESVIIVFIQLHVYNSYLILFDRKPMVNGRTIFTKAHSIDKNTIYAYKYNLLNLFFIHLR